MFLLQIIRKMLRFLPFQWHIHLILLIVIVQNARGFSLNSRTTRNAVAKENVRFQPTPNLGYDYKQN